MDANNVMNIVLIPTRASPGASKPAACSWWKRLPVGTNINTTTTGIMACRNQIGRNRFRRPLKAVKKPFEKSFTCSMSAKRTYAITSCMKLKARATPSRSPITMFMMMYEVGISYCLGRLTQTLTGGGCRQFFAGPPPGQANGWRAGCHFLLSTLIPEFASA